MSDHRPPSPDSAAREAAALRQTGASPLLAGDPGRIGPFVPVALLGKGGMGRVYLSRAADGRPGLFAVKVIRPEYAEDVRFQRRFEREALVHSRIGPPYAPKLCGTGWDDQLLWMATEYVPGLDLSEAVREGGALTPATVWRLVAELGRALAALAAAGVVHRDLKPSNVLLSVKGAHVIDFGISKAAEASAITGTGNRVGTPAYMSPEYLRTGHCDTASDVFSLASSLLFAATGRAPFGDGTGVDVMHRVAFEEPNPEVTGAVSAADPELGALLAACLAKEPERRPTPRELTDTAGAHAGTTGWPEPLDGRVLARQRAYEALHRLPVERAALFHPSGRRAGAPAPSPGRVGSPAAPPAAASASASASASAERASAGSRPAAARPWVRRKRVMAAAAGTMLCAVAAGVLVLMREGGGPATAASPEYTASQAGTRPGRLSDGTALSVAPGVSDRASAAGASSRRAGVTDDGTAQPEDSPSAPAGRPSSPTTRAGDTGSTATPAQSPGTASADPGTPPWIADCTYYAGNGRTRPGDSGKRVLQVQCMLTKRGYDVGSTGVNGEFGSATEAAVRSFQSAKGVTADGVVAHDTWVALRATE
ncbi:protein kinase [Streptomyces sp. NPDC086549]|uniref:protein kinase domain-containing protein n=1 Tax=Streptomyces sp. NPDC086549 TaxID=3365752 RepID=UPI0038099072